MFKLTRCSDPVQDCEPRLGDALAVFKLGDVLAVYYLGYLLITLLKNICHRANHKYITL